MSELAVRAVTNFVVLPSDAALWNDEIIRAANLCAACASRFEASGFTVQTLRIVTNPFGEYLDTSSPAAALAGMEMLRTILTSSAMPQGTRIRFAIGEARTVQEVQLVPHLIHAAADLANCCVNIGCDSLGLPDPALTRAAAECCATLAAETEGGEGNFNFTANFNMAPGCPYFPAAYNRTSAGANFAVGLEYPGLLVSTLLALPADASWEKRFTACSAVVSPYFETLNSISQENFPHYDCCPFGTVSTAAHAARAERRVQSGSCRAARALRRVHCGACRAARALWHVTAPLRPALSQAFATETGVRFAGFDSSAAPSKETASMASVLLVSSQ